MKLKIKEPTRNIGHGLSKMTRKQLPFAASRAINTIAYKIRLDEIKGLNRELHNPTPFTKRGVRYKKASKRKLTAIIYIPPIQAKYLQWSIEGGTRLPKKKAIPIPVGQKVNTYGNMPRTAIKRMMANKKKYFSGKPKGQPSRPGGIYQRMGRGGRKNIRLMVQYKPRAMYKKRFPFYSIAEKRVQRSFRKELRKAMDFAMRTAR